MVPAEQHAQKEKDLDRYRASYRKHVKLSHDCVRLSGSMVLSNRVIPKNNSLFCPQIEKLKARYSMNWIRNGYC